MNIARRAEPLLAYVGEAESANVLIAGVDCSRSSVVSLTELCLCRG